jgi:PERQ amino acid-rich with GYF domain-containing protein
MDGNTSYIPPAPFVSLEDLIVNKKPKKSRPPRNQTRTNGTVTLRRSSTNPLAQSAQAQAQGSAPPPPANADAQPLQLQSNPSYEQQTVTRYSKEDLLDVYRAQQESGAANDDVNGLFVSGWDPGHSNGANGRGWGKSNDGRDNHSPGVCWDANGSARPISLEEMSEEERAVCHPCTYVQVPC